MTCLICKKCIEAEPWLSFMNDDVKLDCCSYICSNKISEQYPKYWDNVVNKDKFNKYPIPYLYIVKENKEKTFKEIQDMSDDEYNEYILNVPDYDKFIREYNAYLLSEREMEEYDRSESSDDELNLDDF